MPRRIQHRRKPSISGLALRLRWQRSWASWRLKRTRRRRVTEARRTVLLLETVDRQHLLEKELGQREAMLAHRLAELEESREFRRTPSVVEAATPLLPPAREKLDQLLRTQRAQHLANPTAEITVTQPPQGPMPLP